MRLQVASDVHSELWNCERFWGAPAAEADALALAGDAFNWSRKCAAKSEDLLAGLCAKHRLVLYLPGNHEYYGTNPEGAESRLAAAAAKIGNLIVLRTGQVHELEGRRILGDTMWFREIRTQRMISDHRAIAGLLPWAWERHRAFRRWLESELRPGDIVITHHAPSDLSVAPQWLGDPFNIFFVAPMQDLILDRRPALWIHGHTHTSFDYKIGSTRIVCNPLGYEGEGQWPLFDPAMVVEA